MNDGMSRDLALGNVRTFFSYQLIPALHQLAALEGFDAKRRAAILEVAAVLCAMPDIDPEAKIRLEVDLYWEDRNWLGTLDLADSALTLRSILYQMEGLKPELCCQWQHTALELKSKTDTFVHDPSHLWFWIDCFRRFVDGLCGSSAAQRGTFQLASHSLRMDLNYGMPSADSELQ